MKNKKLNMVLLPLVGTIWVLLLLRIFGTEGEADRPPASTLEKPIPANDVVVFELQEDYRDPFLDHPGSRNYATSAREKKEVRQQEGKIIRKEVEEEKQNEFRYHGAVSKSRNQKDITGILSIDGESFMLGLSKSTAEIEVLEISMDRIRFRFHQKEYEVTKE